MPVHWQGWTGNTRLSTADGQAVVEAEERICCCGVVEVEGMPKFWCCDESLAMELKGLDFKVCKVEGVGGRHVEVEVDCDVSGVRRRVESGWEGTRRMLERKGFEAYLMLDGPGLRRFIGKKGRGIRGFRRLTGKRVFIVPIVWRENLMFDVFVSSASPLESATASAKKTHCEKD